MVDDEESKSLPVDREDAIATALRHARRGAILVIGGTVVLVGVVLIVLPGPAFVVIPAGLAILATEFVWARRILRRMKKSGAEMLGMHKRAESRRRDSTDSDSRA